MKAYVREAINRLQAESREPFCAYLYDLGGIRAHVRRMRRYMPERTGLFYAIKANPDRRIIEALLPLIDGFEVASAGELLKVREVSGSVPVLFGGPGKKEAELEAAIRHNVSYIHVESLLELRRLIRLTQGRSEPVRILLRMNLRTSALPQTQITMGGRPTPSGWTRSCLMKRSPLYGKKGGARLGYAAFIFTRSRTTCGRSCMPK